MDYIHQITFKGLFLLASFSSTLAAVTTSYRTIMVSDHSEYLVNGYDLELTCTSDRFNTTVFDIYEFTSSAEDILVICASGPSSCTIGPSVNGRSSLSVWINGTLLRLEDYDVAIDARNFICNDRDRSETFSESAITVCDAPTSVMIDVSCNRNSDEVTVVGSSDISNCNLYPTIFITINGEESQCTQETCTFNISSDLGEYNIEVFGALFNVTSEPQEPCTDTLTGPTSEEPSTVGDSTVNPPTTSVIVTSPNPGSSSVSDSITAHATTDASTGDSTTLILAIVIPVGVVFICLVAIGIFLCVCYCSPEKALMDRPVYLPPLPHGPREESRIFIDPSQVPLGPPSFTPSVVDFQTNEHVYLGHPSGYVSADTPWVAMASNPQFAYIPGNVSVASRSRVLEQGLANTRIIRVPKQEVTGPMEVGAHVVTWYIVHQPPT